ncbi:electron transport complex subunit RsxC [Halioxenophilus aromaticivorans]|uniref:Ion-translocating oxidoreductase complex subunit C n=1 Tax=Halioxenophilus aromaticivorans TaxID=1306992 RepID=A0AAV3TZ00_9ALTE
MTASNRAVSGQERQIFPIPGGVHPPQNKAQSNATPLTTAPLPSRVYLPLNQHLGAPAQAIVAVGEKVLTGQVVAAAKGVVSANVHASISGVVSAIEDRTLPHPSGMSGPCIVIESDGADTWVDLPENPQYEALATADLIDIIRQAGVVGLGGAGFPTAVKLGAKSPIEHLIINGTECEPYITADDLLMRTYPDEIIKGTLLLAKVLGNPADVVIGMEDNKPEAFAALQKAAQGTAVQVVRFPGQYPSGGEKQLIQRLTGKEVPSGGLPASVGCVVQNVGTAYAAYRAARFGEPLLSRVTTVVGEALAQSANVTVRLGTPVAELLTHFGAKEKRISRLIMGGPMMGFALNNVDVPVVKTTNCIIAATQQEMPPAPPAQACIRCGLCAEACPASLLPQQMYWYARAEEYEKLEAHNLFDCIECGACSYVCPSRIPLVQYYRSAKGEIRQQREDKIRADRSRQRFEFRQARLAKAEAEKEAKRLARQQAAAKAKAKQAEAATLTQAVAKPAPANDADQVAKLERALASAQTRFNTAQAKHQAALNENSERVDQLAAALKQAQLKLSEAQQKLQQAQAEHQQTNAAATPMPADDPVAAAIAKAQAKHDMTPAQKAQADVESLQKRLTKAQEKLQAAQAEGSDKVPALQMGVDKLSAKLEQAQRDLAQIVPEPPAAPPAQDPAQAAIERAKAKAQAAASMSPQEKLANQVTSLQTRLAKAQAKLAEAQANNADNQDALALGVSKLQDKLSQAQAELGALQE